MNRPETELVNLAIGAGTFTTGKPIRSSQWGKVDYWTGERWSIQRGRKYDYIILRGGKQGDNNTMYFGETVFRTALNATDQIPDSALDNCYPIVLHKATPYQEGKTQATIVWTE